MSDQWELLAKRIEEDVSPSNQFLGKLLLDLKEQVDWIRSRLDLRIRGGNDEKPRANSDTLNSSKPDRVLEEKQS